ncbi:MAG: flagellar biosynthesis protein FlhB [Dehalococcoidia bacterium]
MAGEKTEAPTPRRQEDARKRGQVAHSHEVDSAIVLLAVIGVFRFGGSFMWGELEAMTIDSWAHLNRNPLTVELTADVGLELMVRSVMLLAPLMAAVVAVALIGGMAQTGGPLFSREAVKPQFKRLNPLEGTKRLIASRQAYVNLAKSLIKFTVLGAVGYMVFMAHWDDITTLGFQAGLADSIEILVSVSFDMATRMALVVLALAIGDFIFQKTDLTRQLRMTRQEVIDENRQSEGDPQMKAAIARQRRKLLSRIMESVPKADVVVVNPTHYAVALKYDPTSSNAPIVIAKGMNLVALKMREVAEEHGVPVIQNPPLCRAIYKATRIGQEIPVDLYEAVAEILAFVYRLRSRGALRATA